MLNKFNYKKITVINSKISILEEFNSENFRIFHSMLYNNFYYGITYYISSDDYIEKISYFKCEQEGMKLRIEKENNKKEETICTIKNREEIGITLSYINDILNYEQCYYNDKLLFINKDVDGVYSDDIVRMYEIEEIILINKNFYKKVYKIFYKKYEFKLEKIFLKRNDIEVSKKFYYNDKLYGYSEERNEEGKLLSRGSYLKGNKIGLWQEFENGILVKEKSFGNNEKLIGLYKEYDCKGRVIKEKYFFDGKEIVVENMSLLKSYLIDK